ncbi:MAG TPA: penicillin-binding transpeptidase domain-containing protein [Candidatus Paceibacterota bacterium]|nr:penicillin-binding transpeptidase domain-containing protein [Candidatus Paceibacterota bacterium]HPT18403.1 penicillin-binding transpeptidase domain-containing protein [Candidatus Paceibacterota bacterium]
MNWKFFRKNRLKSRNTFVEPDEIFLDSENLENFDSQQFEGRIEKQISKKTIMFLGIFFVIAVGIFCFRLGFLQIQKGEAYLTRSQNNTLEKQVLFADRGIIYDRNKEELAWNKKDGITNNTDNQLIDELNFAIRTYKSPGFSHLLGYVNYPAKDSSGNFWQTEFIGKDGLEKMYSDTIKGENGSKIVETDVNKKIYSENIINAPKHGADLITTIDSRIQSQMFSYIKNLAESNSFSGGAGILINVENGEILVSTSFPEYNSEILSQGKDAMTIKNYFSDKRKVFMDRAISGLYTPGSIVKPFFALGALNEGIINPEKKILSTGSISIPNPYFPDQKTVFKDWKAHGWTNMKEAIAVSSDVYFYTIGGGFDGQKGLGIANLEKYSKLFGIGEKTGVDLPDEKGGTIPSIEWKAKNFKGDPWRIGDTYHTAIGQYGFQVTPIEMARAVSAIANNGKLISPHFILGDIEKENQKTDLGIKKEYFQTVQEGMRMAVNSGTASALNVPYVKVAAKTGTAQLGVYKNKVNSWVIGFFPYENPKYAFVVMMEAGPSTNSTGASYIIRQTLDWMSINTPEYFQ